MTKTMDIKSLLIGFLLATSVMLFMGSTNYETQKQNKFEIHMNQSEKEFQRGLLLNTETGEVWELDGWNKDKTKLK